MLDNIDRHILEILQQDATMALAEISKRVGLSTTPCWRRIQKLEQTGVIEQRVALLNPEAVGAGVTVFVAITTNQHSAKWLERFHSAIADLPEVVEFYRMSGNVDYMLRLQVGDIPSYDRFYKRLIAKIEIASISSSFAMERIKSTTVLPIRLENDEVEA